MKMARFSFDNDLSPLLPRDKRGGDFDYMFSGPQSIKHLIESLGIPHTELAELHANGHLVGLDYLVLDGDQVTIQSARAVKDGDEEPRFVLDGHLGRLASRLRMLGLDCLYQNDYEDRELVQICVKEERVLLTRDRRLLMHRSIQVGCLLRSLNTERQLHEVYERYGLKKWVRPFQRCLRCNRTLEAVSSEEVWDRLEPLTKLYFVDFHICPGCKQIYWKGSHYEKMRVLITALGAT